MKKTDLAYAAGIVDGEGCIGLYGSDRSIYLQVKISITNEVLMREFHTVFGGSFRHEPPRNERCKSSYRWMLSGKPALEFLKLVYPYLRLKKPQAEVAIEFQEQPFRKRGHVLQEEEKAVLKKLRTQMHNLNKRG